MHRISMVAFIACVVLFNGCSDTAVDPAADTGEVRFRIAAVPASVAELLATLTAPGDTARTLRIASIDSTRLATGTFAAVPPDVWRLSVSGIDTGGIVRYSAGFDVEVFAGEVSSVAGELSAASGSCVDAPAGLVSWWTGDGNTRDAKGGNHPIWLNLVDSAYPALVGKGLLFNGVDSRVRLGDPDNLKLTASMTIEAWLFVTSSPPGRAAAQILLRGDDRIGLDPYWLAVMPDGYFRFHVSSGLAEADVVAPAVYGRWVHVAATLNDADGRMALYVDGTERAAMTTPVRPFRNLDPTQTPGVGIGNTQSMDFFTHHQPFHGFIDELAVYSVALGAQQVQDIYRAGSFGKCKD